MKRYELPTGPGPDWQPAIVDGQPEMLCNRAMVQELIYSSPLGPEEACRRMNEAIRADIEAGRTEPFTATRPAGGGAG